MNVYELYGEYWERCNGCRGTGFHPLSSHLEERYRNKCGACYGRGSFRASAETKRQLRDVAPVPERVRA